MTRIPPGLRALALLFVLPVALIACDGDPSSSGPPDATDTALDFGGRVDGDEIVLERIVGDGPDGPVVVDLVGTVVDDPTTSEVDLDVALRNRSSQPLGLPARVFVGDFSPEGTWVTNADNQLADPLPESEPPAGPYGDWFDYAGTFGDDGRLEPGETSAPRRWRIAVAGGGSFSFGAHVRIGLDPDRAFVGGIVFTDANLDGEFDDVELPFAAGVVEARFADERIARARVTDSGRWRIPVEDPGLVTVRWVAPPTVGILPLCNTTPNPLQVVVVRGEDGRPLSYADADFGVAPGPCPPRDDVVRLTSAPADSIRTDPFRLIDARVIASPDAPDLPPTTWFVEVRVGFSGCGPDHPVRLFAGDDFFDTNPPSTWLRLSHDDRGELCEAWFEETRLFDLTPLVRLYARTFGDEPPNFTMELVGPTGQSFQLSVP